MRSLPDATQPSATLTASATLTFTVLAPVTERIDRFLADQLQLSRTQAARLVAQGGVAVNATLARASRTLIRGEQVTVTFPEQEPPRQPLVFNSNWVDRRNQNIRKNPGGKGPTEPQRNLQGRFC